MTTGQRHAITSSDEAHLAFVIFKPHPELVAAQEVVGLGYPGRIVGQSDLTF